MDWYWKGNGQRFEVKKFYKNITHKYLSCNIECRGKQVNNILIDDEIQPNIFE